jgi:hypothetical protein
MAMVFWMLMINVLMLQVLLHCRVARTGMEMESLMLRINALMLQV